MQNSPVLVSDIFMAFSFMQIYTKIIEIYVLIIQFVKYACICLICSRSYLTFHICWTNSADNKLVIFLVFLFQKTGFDVTFRLFS